MSGYFERRGLRYADHEAVITLAVIVYSAL